MQIADLSLPVAVCEPVTDMQRRGDFLEYAELLHEVLHPKLAFSGKACTAATPLYSLESSGKALPSSVTLCMNKY